jgi:hypothetical protein
MPGDSHPAPPVARRSLLAALFGLPLLRHAPPSAGATSPDAPRRWREVDRFAVAGYRYHQGPDHEASLRAGHAVRLAREPANEHDDRAIAVYAGEVKLGYVPRRQNSMAAGCLDAGVALRATLVGVDLEAPPWERVTVTLEVEAGG